MKICRVITVFVFLILTSCVEIETDETTEPIVPEVTVEILKEAIAKKRALTRAEDPYLDELAKNMDGVYMFSDLTLDRIDYEAAKQYCEELEYNYQTGSWALMHLPYEYFYTAANFLMIDLRGIDGVILIRLVDRTIPYPSNFQNPHWIDKTTPGQVVCIRYDFESLGLPEPKTPIAPGSFQDIDFE